MVNHNSIPVVGVPGRSSWPILRRCYSYLAPFRAYVVGSYLLLLLITSLNLAIPQFIRWIIDQGIRQQALTLLGWSVLALLGLTLLKGFFTFWQGRWTEMAAQGVAYTLRNAIQTKLTQLSFAYHDQSETGQLLSRAIQDVERIRFLTGRATLRIIDSAFLFITSALVLVWMNPRLAALLIAVIPLLIYRALQFGRRARPLSVLIQDQLGVVTGRLEQNLRGTKTVKAFAQEPAEIAKFEQQNEAWFNLAAQEARLEALNPPLFNLLANISLVLILGYGGWLVIEQQLTLGELVAFTTYLGQLLQPLRLFGMVIPAIAMAGASGERIFEILDSVPDVKDAPNAYPLPPITGRVQFETLSFSYLQRRAVLTNINFEARPGQIIALLGPTGSGKSSLINLIPRFYDPTSGRVLIDGHDIRQVTVHSLRSQIGMVLQETTLFAATIAENIAFGRPQATQEEIMAAAQAAQAHPFISQMSNGYQTKVGERGVTLSGGQKQRIAIARAILTDPRILILDDATASVDVETEHQIQAALDQLMTGRTTFVIAHRLSTVRRADLVLVLQKGQIVASGRHDTLLHTSPLYAEIYDRQLRPQE